MRVFSIFKAVGVQSDDLLLRIKLENECSIVDQWVIVVNTLRWNGDKVVDADINRIIADSFYDRFRDRLEVKIVTVSPFDRDFPIWDNTLRGFCAPGSYESDYRNYVKTENKCKVESNKELERFMLSAARHHFSYAYDILSDVAESEDIVIIADLDESLDAANRQKRAIITEFLMSLSKERQGGRVLRHKFQYDYDNSWPKCSYQPNQEWGTRWIACIPWSIIKEYGRYAVQDLRGYGFRALVDEQRSLGLEYTLCCSRSELAVKYRVNGHANTISLYDISLALKLNVHCRDATGKGALEKMTLFRDSVKFHQIPQLDENRSCGYVLNNLGEIKTHNVPYEYTVYRKRFEALLDSFLVSS